MQNRQINLPWVWQEEMINSFNLWLLLCCHIIHPNLHCHGEEECSWPLLPRISLPEGQHVGRGGRRERCPSLRGLAFRLSDASLRGAVRTSRDETHRISKAVWICVGLNWLHNCDLRGILPCMYPEQHLVVSTGDMAQEDRLPLELCTPATPL